MHWSPDRVFITVSADYESHFLDFLPAVHMLDRQRWCWPVMERRLSVWHRALPLISSSCAHSPQAGAFLSAEQRRAQLQRCAHRPVTSVQKAQAAKASYNVSRHHTHKGITATTSNVTKLRLSGSTVFKRGMFLLCRSSCRGYFLTFCEHLTGPTKCNPLRKPITYRF